MHVEYGPVKDKANRAAHGVSLGLAQDLDWDAALVWVDERFAYDELRMIALAPETQTLYYVAFVERGDVRLCAAHHQPSPCNPSRGETLCRKLLSAPT